MKIARTTGPAGLASALSLSLFPAPALPLALALALALTGCANPINRVTSDDYAEACSVAEAGNRLDVAEQTCYRALVNVDLGNLGPELKSQRLYNLGRIKRRLSKFVEAERLYRSSLAIEEKLSPPGDPKIGRRLVELAMTLAAQDRWAEGAPVLERVLPTAGRFGGNERAVTTTVLAEYAKRLRALNQPQPARAERFAAAAAALR